MIVIKTRQPDPELEQKIRMLLEREHIEAEQISIDSWEKLVLPGLTLDGMTHEVSCNDRKVSRTNCQKRLAKASVMFSTMTIMSMSCVARGRTTVLVMVMSQAAPPITT